MLLAIIGVLQSSSREVGGEWSPRCCQVVQFSVPWVRCSFFVPGRPSGNPWERRAEKHQTQWLSMVCQEMPPPAGTSFLCTPLTPAYLWTHTPHPSLHRGTHFLIRAYTGAHLHTHQAYANKPSCEPVCIIFFLPSPSKIYTDHAYIST